MNAYSFRVFVFRFIKHVFSVITVSDVRPSIVISFMVYVVNLVSWELTFHIKECKAVRSIFHSFNTNHNVSMLHEPSNRADNNSTSTVALFQVDKYASIRVVMKKFFESFLGYNRLSRWLTSFESLVRVGVLQAPRSPIIPWCRYEL